MAFFSGLLIVSLSWLSTSFAFTEADCTIKADASPYHTRTPVEGGVLVGQVAQAKFDQILKNKDHLRPQTATYQESFDQAVLLDFLKIKRGESVLFRRADRAGLTNECDNHWAAVLETVCTRGETLASAKCETTCHQYYGTNIRCD